MKVLHKSTTEMNKYIDPSHSAGTQEQSQIEDGFWLLINIYFILD